LKSKKRIFRKIWKSWL